MADSSEPAFLFLYRKEAVAPVDYLSTFATAPFYITAIPFSGGSHIALCPTYICLILHHLLIRGMVLQRLSHGRHP